MFSEITRNFKVSNFVIRGVYKIEKRSFFFEVFSPNKQKMKEISDGSVPTNNVFFLVVFLAIIWKIPKAGSNLKIKMKLQK